MKAARKQYLIAAAHSRALAKISGGIAAAIQAEAGAAEKTP
jgi:hypothetical protein